ncbi:MAG TPA: ribosome biogenesis GTP-binding protein YihA/YsxC [Bacteroidales bacterium]|nr:ribosome biogenesis GTP-binding protein YihA/YsxC [Bacteroidales bacterium]
MIIRSATYVKSCTSYKNKPTGNQPEFAFIGRSNVGKSSLINMLVNRKALARTSNKPGKTQTLNYYLINEQWYLVDLPGYGFAKVSQTQREQWDTMLKEYIVGSDKLYAVFMLIDSRIPLQQSDMDFMLFMGKNQVPFIIVSTKCDKINLRAVSKHTKELNNFLDEYWESRPQHIISSSEEKKGRNEILSIIENALNPSSTKEL